MTVRQYLADAMQVPPAIVNRGTLLFWIELRAEQVGDGERATRARAAYLRGVEATLKRVAERRKREGVRRGEV